MSIGGNQKAGGAGARFNQDKLLPGGHVRTGDMEREGEGSTFKVIRFQKIHSTQNFPGTELVPRKGKVTADLIPTPADTPL